MKPLVFRLERISSNLASSITLRQVALLSVVSAVVYAAGFAYILYKAFLITHGHQIYCLDDVYIHAAIARHLVQDHTFGIAPHVFSAASSSILWPLLLAACFQMFGIHIFFPLLLNAIFAVLVLSCSAYFLWKLYPAAPWPLLLGLQIALLVSTPLLTVTFAGMEHTLQILLTIWFVYLTIIVISEVPISFSAVPRSRPGTMYLAAFLLVATRYEGAFTVVAAALLLLLQKRFRIAVFALLSGAMAPIIFGLYSVLHGSHFLPNSLLLKAGEPTLHRVLGSQMFQMLGAPYAWTNGPLPLWIFAIILLFMLWNRQEIFSKRSVALCLFVLTCGFHLQLAKLGWFWRYEAYLIAMGIFVLFLNAAETIGTSDYGHSRSSRWVLVLTGCLLVATLQRAKEGNLAILPCILAIYSQQYQMAQFVDRYYPGSPLVANDVGAISYFSNRVVVDVFGLGSIAVTNLRLAGQYTPESLNALARAEHAPIAIVYRSWVEGLTGGTPNWIRVGTWTLIHPYPVVLGGDQITFYAISPQDDRYLKQSLLDYCPSLPANVKSVSYADGLKETTVKNSIRP